MGCFASSGYHRIYLSFQNLTERKKTFKTSKYSHICVFLNETWSFEKFNMAAHIVSEIRKIHKYFYNIVDLIAKTWWIGLKMITINDYEPRDRIIKFNMADLESSYIIRHIEFFERPRFIRKYTNVRMFWDFKRFFCSNFGRRDGLLDAKHPIY